jgi:general nucleoside transport system permease protein
VREGQILRLALVVLAAAVVPIGCFALAGISPWRVATTLLSYPFGSGNLSEVLVEATPLILMGLGVAVALRTGLYNVGSDGQFLGGALLAVAIAPTVQDWGWIGLAAFLSAGFLGGGLLGAGVGWLRARFGVNEIIATIMLNYIIFQASGFLIRGPLQEAMHVFPRSDPIPDNCNLPLLISGTRLHAGILVALVAVVMTMVLLRYTRAGFEWTILGVNPAAAVYAGFRRTVLIAAAMGVSGGLAGLSGAIEVAGVYHRLEDGMGAGLGLSAIAVALIAGPRIALIPLISFLFGALFAGAGALQREDALPFPIVWIIEASLVFAIAGIQWAVRPRAAA